MEDNTDFSATIPTPTLDVERKTLPVKCLWCNTIAGVAEIDVKRDMVISPFYRLCGKFRHLFVGVGIIGWNFQNKIHL